MFTDSKSLKSGIFLSLLAISPIPFSMVLMTLYKQDLRNLFILELSSPELWMMQISSGFGAITIAFTKEEKNIWQKLVPGGVIIVTLLLMINSMLYGLAFS